jgi:hypothetical protein
VSGTGKTDEDQDPDNRKEDRVNVGKTAAGHKMVCLHTFRSEREMITQALSVEMYFIPDIQTDKHHRSAVVIYRDNDLCKK